MGKMILSNEQNKSSVHVTSHINKAKRNSMCVDMDVS